MGATNVTTGKPKTTGSVYVAPLGTTLPTDATTALGSAFKSLGYVSENGMTNGNTFDSTKIKEWGGGTVLDVEDNYNDNFNFELLETLDVEVLKTVYGSANVTGSLSAGISVSVKPEQHPDLCWVFEMIMRGNVAKRIVLPSASISSLAEIQYRANAAAAYGITLAAHLDSSGMTHYEYIKAPSTSSGSGG